jgi:membrane protease YdiL (CAAX protease family)
LWAGLLAGIPMSAAAGCMSKAIEIWVVLRLAPRSRGAALGMLAWLGQAAFLVVFACMMSPPLLLSIMRRLAGVRVRVPLFEWLIGLSLQPSAATGVAHCCLLAALLIALAVHLSAKATQRGLAGSFGDAPSAPRVLRSQAGSGVFGHALYRKELLWLWRDRGAIVQVFLVPLTVTAFQLFNMRYLLAHATEAWQLMAGSVVLFGSYFLLTLGPRSLVSEGAALWLPLTWPHGLDALLKAKAQLWWMVSMALVLPLLLLTAARFPSDGWKLALVAVGWGVFGHGLAQRSVTVVTVPTSGGEPVPTSRAGMWGVSLGTFTFALGLISQQWQLAIVGVVYGVLTTAALWQSFRARLPYLLDPWSERLPQPPTLVHAMVAIGAMTELMSVVVAVMTLVAGRDDPGLALATAYGVCALGASICTSYWLARRGVTLARIMRFSNERLGAARVLGYGLLACGLGVTLGLVALAYVYVLEHQLGIHPRANELASLPDQRVWMSLLAIGFAPLAEEYLFRGLLFRALDREWSSARAIWGSACFFAIYHGAASWLPVAMLGATSAWLFKRGGHLVPCVMLHATYNAVVVWSAA